jgi:SpoVK/Ycf46/Vps4 family AAA+-type ATPase
MGEIKSLEPRGGKRQGFVLFLSSLVPTPKLSTNGDFGLEFPVIGFLADKGTNAIVKILKKRKEKKKKKVKHKIQQLKPHSSDDEIQQKEPKSNEASSDDEKEEEPKSHEESSDDLKQEETNSNGVTTEDEKQNESKSNSSAKDDTKQESQDNKYSRQAVDKELEDSLEGTVQKLKPDTTWDKVAGLQNAKCQLQIAAELPQKQPSLFTGNRKAPQFILLYGPPGTGKGHLAKALCNSVDSTLFIVSASDMTSKWHGESER